MKTKGVLTRACVFVALLAGLTSMILAYASRLPDPRSKSVIDPQCPGGNGTYHGAPTDGSAWLSGGEQKYRVLRGGSWYARAAPLRSASRDATGTPDARNYNIGFRVVAVARTQ
jgi:hypothetical protein